MRIGTNYLFVYNSFACRDSMKWNEVSLFVFTKLETHFFKGQSKRQEQSQMALGDDDHIQLNTFLLVDGCSLFVPYPRDLKDK